MLNKVQKHLPKNLKNTEQMNLKPLMLAAGSVILLGSAAIAQVASQISAYRDQNNTVWITGLRDSTRYQVQNVLRNGTTSTINPTTNRCGVARIPQSDKYQKLSVNGVTFNVASLPQKAHERCNPNSRNTSR
jgi:hypothetical protein